MAFLSEGYDSAAFEYPAMTFNVNLVVFCQVIHAGIPKGELPGKERLMIMMITCNGTITSYRKHLQY